MLGSRWSGLTVAIVVALVSLAGVVWMLAPPEMLGLEPAAQAAPGAASAGALSWMAWTPETAAFFLFILLCLSVMTMIELIWPGGAPRTGILGLDTTRGDRLFLSLLGTAFILLAWLGLMGPPLWGGVAIAVLWWGFVFAKV